MYGAAEAAATGRPRRSATAAAAAEPRDVALVCPRRAVPRPGAELTINYGDKSNEELLFLYGFALEDNPAEVLTLMCPLPPPAEWDAQLRARLALLAARGARPQLHLPAADLARLGGGQAAKAAKAARAGLAGSDAGVLASDLPEGVLETLEVFVMEPAELATALEAADGSGSGGSGSGGSGSGSGGGGAGGGAASELEVAGRRMALLTTLVRLLELKALEMEGREEGEAPAVLSFFCGGWPGGWRALWIVVAVGTGRRWPRSVHSWASCRKAHQIYHAPTHPSTSRHQARAPWRTTSACWRPPARSCRPTSDTRCCTAWGRSGWRAPTWCTPRSCCSRPWRIWRACSVTTSGHACGGCGEWWSQRRVPAPLPRPAAACSAPCNLLDILQGSLRPS